MEHSKEQNSTLKRKQVKNMGKRIVSLLLTFVLVFSGMTWDITPAYAATDTEKEVVADAYDADAVTEDVPIYGLDVPYQEIVWEEISQPKGAPAVRNNEIIMVLDISGSMSGTPLTQMKKACFNFIDDILAEDENAGIGVVTFESSVTAYTFGEEYFTNDRNALRNIINGLTHRGGTAMNAGVQKADEILHSYGTAQNKFMIQMADGVPNSGVYYNEEDARYYGENYVDPEGNEFTHAGSGYCSAIYNTFMGINNLYNIYSLGFFHSMRGAEKQFAATFMNDIQNRGYFEVTDADNLTFSFEDIADNISTDMIFFNKSSLVLTEDAEETLELFFSPAYPSTDKTTQWSSSNEMVATVTKDGKIKAVGAGTCKISAEAGGYKVSCSVTVKETTNPVGKISVMVQQNEKVQSSNPKLVAAAGAQIIYNGDNYIANKDGKVALPEITTGEISISKAGFCTRTIAASYVEDGMTIVLQQETDNPVINAVWLKGKNLLTDEYKVELTSNDLQVISVDVDWRKSSYGKLQLAQEATFVDFSAGSNVKSLVLKSKFDVTKDIYIVATGKDGFVSKQKLKFKVDSKISNLDGLSLSLGKMNSLTLPDDIPLVGGSKVGLTLENELLPISVAFSDGKVKVAIGLDMVKYTEKNTTYANKDDETKKKLTTLAFIEEVKNFKKVKGNLEESAKTLKNIKNKYKDALTEKKGTFAFSAKFTVMGYMEGYVDSQGKLTMTESGLVLGVETSAKWKKNTVIQVSIVPVPVYMEAAIDSKIQAVLNLYYSGNGSKYVPGGSISASLEGSIGGGLGNTNIATIGGGGKVKFAPSATFYSDRENYFALTTSIDFYFKITALGMYEYKWEPDGLKAKWTIDNGVKSLASKGYKGAARPDLYDATTYELADLDYIVEAAPAIEEGVVPDISGKYAHTTATFHENALAQTSPKIVEFAEGSKLAVWMDSFESNANAVKVYYSFYDGNAWSEPAVVEEDDTADLTVDIYAHDNEAYVIWQDATELIKEGETLASLTDVQVKAAVFSVGTEAFGETAVLNKTENVLAEMPIIFGNGNTVTAAWVENTESDWFLTRGSNSILTSTYSNDGWSEPAVAYSDVSTITSLAGDVAGATTYLAYTIDADKDLNTTEDQEVFVNGTKITDNQLQDSAVQFEDHTLYWMRGGNIFYTEDLEKENISAKSVLPEGNTLLFNTYSVVADGKNKAVLFAVKDELKSNVQGVFYQKDDDVWGSPITLTNPEDKSDITAFAALWAEDDTLELLCNKVAVTGELIFGEMTKEEAEAYYNGLYGGTNLEFMVYEPQHTISIADAYYDKSTIVSNGVMPVTLSVTNNDMNPVSGVTVEVYSEDEKIDSFDIVKEIANGATEDVSFNYAIRNEDIGKTIKFSCMPLNGSGNTTEDSITTVDLTYEDVAQDNLKWTRTSDTTVAITGDVKNYGFHPQENVEVSLHKGSVDSVAVKTLPLGKVGVTDVLSFSFDVNYEENAVYYVVVSSTGEDINYGNNEDFVVLASEKNATGRKIKSISASMSKTAYSVGEALNMSNLLVTAVYDDGTKSNVTADAVVDTSKINMNAAGTQKITIRYEGCSTEIQIQVSAKAKVKVGDKVTKKKLTYVVTSVKKSNPTVALVGSTNKKSVKTISIPATVEISGTKYKVTAIKAKALKGCKKLTKVTIGKNVTKIEKEAFKDCKKLSNVTIGAKKLKSIGKNAFKGIKKTATFKVPKGKLKSYKKILKKTSIGYKKTWKIR